MGRSKIYISHSEEFELVSPTRVLSSGYLFLLFKYKGSVGGFIWNDCSNYSYAYDSISGNYVVTARVHENISYFDNDWGNDTDPENWNSVVSFLELHNITYTVDASNVVNRTPSINPRMHGYRCSGYHLINIPCTFMTEDDARSGFKKDVARWKIESNIMDDAYKNETERRKKKGIEKRKVTMALKREERERTTSNTEIKKGIKKVTNAFNIDESKVVDPTNIKIMFGKYNGRLLGDMNTNEEINYLNWLCNTFTQNILTNTHKPTKFYYALKTKCKQQVQHT